MFNNLKFEKELINYLSTKVISNLELFINEQNYEISKLKSSIHEFERKKKELKNEYDTFHIIHIKEIDIKEEKISNIKEEINTEMELIMDKIKHNKMNYTNELNYLDSLKKINISNKEKIIKEKASLSENKKRMLKENSILRQIELTNLISFNKESKNQKKRNLINKKTIDEIEEKVLLKQNDYENLLLKKRESHKTYFKLKNNIIEYKEKIQNNNNLIQNIVNNSNQKQTNDSILNLLNQNESYNDKIKEIELGVEYNILDYLKEIDEKSKQILYDIQVLKNKKNQLEQLNHQEQKMNKEKEKIYFKNKKTQTSLNNKLNDINYNIEKNKEDILEIELKEQEIKKNYQQSEIENKMFLDNLVEKESLLIDNVKTEFLVIENNYNEKKSDIIKLMKEESKKIKNSQTKLNNSILLKDKSLNQLDNFKKNNNKNLVKLNKLIIKERKLKKLKNNNNID